MALCCCLFVYVCLCVILCWFGFVFDASRFVLLLVVDVFLVCCVVFVWVCVFVMLCVMFLCLVCFASLWVLVFVFCVFVDSLACLCLCGSVLF